jgi:hypothetical protein
MKKWPHAGDETNAIQYKPSAGLYDFSSQGQPSKQAVDINLPGSANWGNASGGFWGGRVGTEYGNTFFVGAGIGRTNLRNYFNLNFDPNDA